MAADPRRQAFAAWTRLMRTLHFGGRGAILELQEGQARIRRATGMIRPVPRERRGGR